MRLVDFLTRVVSSHDLRHPVLLEEQAATGREEDRQVFVLRPSDSGQLVVGRSVSAQVTIADSRVSAAHAELFERNGRWTLVDLGSTNGTFVDGRRLEERVLHPLEDLTRVSFGPAAEFVFMSVEEFVPLLRTLSSRTAAGPTSTTRETTKHVAIQPAPAASAPRAPRRAPLDAERPLFLVGVSVDPIRLALGATIVFGRTPGHATVVLNDPAVSRGHAELAWTEGGLRLQDLGSVNGTFVAGTRIGADPVELAVGTPFSIGPFELVVRDPASEDATVHDGDSARVTNDEQRDSR